MDAEAEHRHFAGLSRLVDSFTKEEESGTSGPDLFLTFRSFQQVERYPDNQSSLQGLIEPFPLAAPTAGSCDLDLLWEQPPPLEDAEDGMLHLYTYSPLPTPSSIRVLEILNATVLVEGQFLLAHQISTVDLKDDPTYYALSYTWGNPRMVYKAGRDDDAELRSAADQCFPILCDGRILMVSRNLYDALKQLRESDELGPLVEGQTNLSPLRYIWIDAICINQGDTPERNSQVEMMGEIYKSASLVLVWLGPRGWFTDQALATISTICSIAKEHQSTNLSHVDIYSSSWWEERSLWWPGDWSGFYVYLHHTWFRRSWIVQEVSLAKQAVILCGDAIVTWDTIVFVCQFLYINGWHIQLEKTKRLLVDGEVPSNRLYRLHNLSAVMGTLPIPSFMENSTLYFRGRSCDLPIDLILEIGRITRFVKKKATLHLEHYPTVLRETLMSCRQFDATDPRDKIYAFLSIAEVPFIRDGPRPIRVDYQKSVSEVYTETTTYILSATHSIDNIWQSPSRNLELLWHVEDRSQPRHVDLPSWVPDFSVEMFPEPFDDRVANLWNVWPLNSRPKYPPSADKDVLRTLGARIDEVAEVARSDGDPLSAAVSVAMGLSKMYRRPGDPSSTSNYNKTQADTATRDFFERLNSLETLQKLSSRRTSTISMAEPDPEVSMLNDRLGLLRRTCRGRLPPVSSSRPQSRVEVLWRTLLFDYCGQDPAPLIFGFAFGDWIIRRIEEAYVGHLMWRNETSKNRLEKEIRLWQDLLSDDNRDRAGNDEGGSVHIQWPATGQSESKVLRVQFDDELSGFTRSMAEHLERESDSLSNTVNEALPSAEEAEKIVKTHGPIRFIPDENQLFRVLMRENPEMLPERSDPHSRQAKFFQQYSLCNKGRRVFRTKRGWFGLGHKSVMEGDQVWFLAHCTVPFLLRPVEEGAYRIVGVCYVHGLMHREKSVMEWEEVVQVVIK